MQITIVWLGHQYEEWGSALNIRLLKKLEGPISMLGYASGDRYVRNWIACLRSILLVYCQLQRFELLQMQHATVVIANKNGNAKRLMDRWSIQKEKEAAEKVCRKLLQHEGAQVLMAEYKIWQEI